MLKQKCVCCESNKKLVSIFRKGTSNGDSDDYSGKFICKECLEESEKYGVCELCTEETVYHIKDLKGYQGQLYCKEHHSEVIPIDDEEEEDWDSFAEYILDPAHCD